MQLRIMGIMQKTRLRPYFSRRVFYIIPDHIMRTKVEAARLCGFDQNSVNHPGILLWPIQRSFLLWMKLTHVVDRHLTTQMPAQRHGISARQCRRLLSRYRESGPLCMANRR